MSFYTHKIHLIVMLAHLFINQMAKMTLYPFQVNQLKGENKTERNKNYNCDNLHN